MKKFDDLYLDYQDEELDVKMALEATGIDPRIAAKAAKYYQAGKAQDLVYAENALASGANFNTVRKIVSGNIKKRAKARPDFDDTLRKALLKAGKLPDIYHAYQAHHIVAKGDRRAERAIEILQALGIDIDDPANGVFLPASEQDKAKGTRKDAYVHNRVHTGPYHANVAFQVVSLYTQMAGAGMNNQEQKAEMVELLNDIASQLKKGKYPIHQFIPGAEAFAI